MFGKLPKSPNLVCPKLPSFLQTEATDGGPEEDGRTKRLHNVVFRNSFLFFPHTHFLWGEKGHRQGTYRESSLRGLLIIKFYQLYVFSVAVRQLSSSIWASQPALPLQLFLFKLLCSYPSVLSCRSNSIEFKGEVGILKRVPYIVESCGINCKLRVPSSSWRVPACTTRVCYKTHLKQYSSVIFKSIYVSVKTQCSCWGNIQMGMGLHYSPFLLLIVQLLKLTWQMDVLLLLLPWVCIDWMEGMVIGVR